MHLYEFFMAAVENAVILPVAVLMLAPVKNHITFQKRNFYPAALLTLVFTVLALAALETYRNRFSALAVWVVLLIMLLCCFSMISLQRHKLMYVFASAAALVSFTHLGKILFEAWLFPEKDSFMPTTWGLVFQWALLLPMTAAAWFFLHKNFVWIAEHSESKKIWRYAWIPSAAIAVCNTLLVPTSYEVLHSREVRITLIAAALLRLLLFVLLQLIFYQVLRAALEKIEINKKNLVLQLQAQQYRTLRTYLDRTRQMRHDYKHVVRTVQELRKRGDYDGIGRFLEEYEAVSAFGEEQFSFCAQASVNAVLSHYINLARQRQIRTKCVVSLPEALTVSEVDLSLILGNLLENAINGCMTVPSSERHLELSIDVTEDAELYLVIRNSFDGIVQRSENRFVRAHGGEEAERGIGIFSVKETAAKYDGMTEFDAEGKEFCACVMLRTPKNEGEDDDAQRPDL